MAFMRGFIRNYASMTSRQHKRFYKDVSVISSRVNSQPMFEICLDGKKVKTPKKHTLYTKNEVLANMVATEWDCQSDVIDLARMHLTTLSFTSIDNPQAKSPSDLVNEILLFLDGDTLLYQAAKGEPLAEFQKNLWQPLIDWINERYALSIFPSTSLNCPQISDDSYTSLTRYLSYYDHSSLFGYLYAVDCLKSLISTIAVIEHKIGAEAAVRLSSLETSFQTDSWGRIEDVHDAEHCEMLSRLSAGILFAQLNAVPSQSSVRKMST